MVRCDSREHCDECLTKILEKTSNSNFNDFSHNLVLNKTFYLCEFVLKIISKFSLNKIFNIPVGFGDLIDIVSS